ncbi:hypothetical protein C8Q74DRAFT_1308786 [Fomes fomentarius]|nr:hypothetical protein C8Q74DRAFT_1308786 [Fomes fomentarius]
MRSSTSIKKMLLAAVAIGHSQRRPLQGADGRYYRIAIDVNVAGVLTDFYHDSQKAESMDRNQSYTVNIACSGST